MAHLETALGSKPYLDVHLKVRRESHMCKACQWLWLLLWLSEGRVVGGGGGGGGGGGS